MKQIVEVSSTGILLLVTGFYIGWLLHILLGA